MLALFYFSMRSCRQRYAHFIRGGDVSDWNISYVDTSWKILGFLLVFVATLANPFTKLLPLHHLAFVWQKHVTFIYCNLTLAVASSPRETKLYVLLDSSVGGSESVMSGWRWINQWKSGAGCLRSRGVWKIHVYFGVEWQWTRAQRLCSLGDGRHHVRAPLAAVEATNEGPPALTNSHAITFREDLQSWAWLPASSGGWKRRGRVWSLALSPPKHSHHLKCIPAAI